LTEADVYVAQAVVDFDDKRYDDALANLRRASASPPSTSPTTRRRRCPSPTGSP
jgi:hypothetical protein